MQYGAACNKKMAKYFWKQLVPWKILTGCPYTIAAGKGLSYQQSSVFKAFWLCCPYAIAPSAAKSSVRSAIISPLQAILAAL